MSLISNLGRFLFSRHVLMAMLVVLLCTAIFVGGPLLSFGGWYPLESIAARLALMVLVLALLLLRPRQLPTWLFGAVLLALLVWFGGPSLNIGATRPLALAETRLFLIGAIAVLAALYGAYLLWRLANLDGSWLWQQLRRLRATSAPANAVPLDLIDGIVTRALRQLKQRPGRGSGWLRWFDGSRYLYQLPWYLVLGAPNSGKTSVILNSGLQCVSPRKGTEPDTAAPSATAHCEWWLANQAVLIDTAGGYTLQPKQDERHAPEWRTLLSLLKRHRPHAPLNGVLLTLDATHLLARDASERMLEAAALRARLIELRQRLGVRLPVYVVLSKLDMLAGFQEYFGSLTAAERAQVWGFTLPYDEKKAAGSNRGELRSHCGTELAALTRRLEQGVAQRLQEESDLSCRKTLYTLPHEFAHLVEPLLDLLDAIFVDAKYDATPVAHHLRGVYLSSAAQPHARAEADAPTLVQRLLRQTASGPNILGAESPVDATAAAAINALSVTPNSALAASAGGPRGSAAYSETHPRPAAPLHTSHSFFLHGLFAKLILNEAHLVRPNRRSALHYRLAHWAAHAVALAAFAWLALELTTSFSNNQAYLAAIDTKAQALNHAMHNLDANPAPADASRILSAVREIPAYSGLNLDDPARGYRFGLYSAPPIVTASTRVYASLQDRWLLPPILERVEAMLKRALADNDAQATYDTLRVYLMLHEPQRYDAKDVKALLMCDPHAGDASQAQDSLAISRPHLEAMLGNGRALRAASPPDLHLVTEARRLLGSTTAAQRLYERAKATLMTEAPPDFTLVGAVGPQAWAVFRRASGEPLDRGIPGLFTLAGYREVFKRRLPGMLDGVRRDEAWVMGRIPDAAPASLAASAFGSGPSDPLLDDIRSLYLSEYASHWQTFLTDIRVAHSDNRALVLQTLRTFSTLNSPLLVLARTAARQTTLAPQPAAANQRAGGGESLLGKAVDRLSPGALKHAGQLQTLLPDPAASRQERELVDNRFAALREIVGVAPSDAGATAGSGGNGNTQLEAMTRMIDDYYALLLMSDTASAGQAPPAQGDAKARLRLTAATSPAPLHNILTDLLQAGTETISQATGGILRDQQRGVIGESCTRAIVGKYPFAVTTTEIAPDEFARVFSAGGILDNFFQKSLAAHVDTTSRPWRYRPTGPDSPALHGPALAPYERARAIRDTFFRGQDPRKIDWKIDLKVVEMDPEITELILDFDGQKQRYVHGPVKPLTVTWPGPRGGSVAQISAKPARRAGPRGASTPSSGLIDDTEIATISANGPWALIKLLSRGRTLRDATGEYLVEYDFDGRKVVLEVSGDSVPNPRTVNMLRAFRCPVLGER